MAGVAEIFADGFVKFKNYLKERFSYLSDVDAEDIVQQTALSLLGRSDEEDTVEYLSSYIYASLRNGAKNMFRKRRREVLKDDIDRGFASSAEDELVNRELWEQIEFALSQLDEKSRFVFEQTEFEGKSYKELSELTGEPVGTLLSRKSRAAKKLMMILDDYRKL
ncbi:MAG: RNA polymerase sigma factor [Burkholderiales bacterium]